MTVSFLSRPIYRRVKICISRRAINNRDRVIIIILRGASGVGHGRNRRDGENKRPPFVYTIRLCTVRTVGSECVQVRSHAVRRVTSLRHIQQGYTGTSSATRSINEPRRRRGYTRSSTDKFVSLFFRTSGGTRRVYFFRSLICRNLLRGLYYALDRNGTTGSSNETVLDGLVIGTF